MTAESLFATVVSAAREFKSYAAELYVKRLLRHAGIAGMELSLADLPKLCTAAQALRADEFNGEGLDAFVDKLRKLSLG